MRTFIVILYFIVLFGCEDENRSPCILQATYDSGASSSFAFRKDGTFQWTNGSGLGVFTTEGKYTLIDSVITLDTIGFDRVVKSRRLLITSVQPRTGWVGGKYIIQVDDQNRLIDSMFIFTVYIDRRDSNSTGSAQHRLLR